MKHLELIVKGRVQGIGYRFFVERVANELGVTGYVKNMTDGSVKVEAEASRDVLELFTAELKKGPSIAYVESVFVNITDNLEYFKKFGVKF